jgi:PPOX class probable F420-dependent enzyme
MASAIPDTYLDLFSKRAFAHLATLMLDGSPQVTPVWVDLIDGHLIVNSAVGRLKDRNIRRDPRVAIEIIDPDNPYRHVAVRGKVVEVTQAGADEHINKMAKKYLAKDVYPFRQPGEVRVIYRIKPERVSTMG